MRSLENKSLEAKINKKILTQYLTQYQIIKNLYKLDETRLTQCDNVKLS